MNEKLARALMFGDWDIEANGWIPVTERLPDPGVRTLVRQSLTEIPEVVVGCRLEDMPNTWWRLEGFATYAGLETVTHWMSLPEPPHIE